MRNSQKGAPARANHRCTSGAAGRSGALATGGGPRQRLTKKEGPLGGLKDLADRGVPSELTLSISSISLLMTEPRLRTTLGFPDYTG